MKNQALYQQYAILGWPCHFFTGGAADKYNAFIEKCCKRLPEGATDLSRSQQICRCVYIRYLNVYDIVTAVVTRSF
jgi:hypothetical protein